MSFLKLGKIGYGWSDWGHVPRMPEAIGSYILTSIGASTAYATVVGNIVISVATNYAISALSPKPNFGGLGTSKGRLINAREAAEPQQYVYGKVRKGGTIVNMATDGESNQSLHIIIALAGHEVDSIGDIYINDKVVTLNAEFYVTDEPWVSNQRRTVRITKYDGSQTTDQTDWPTSEGTGVGRGIAFLHVLLEYDQDAFAEGIPSITAVVDGKKVYDPRAGGQSATDSSTWTYSANSALCIADYLRADYGLGDQSYSRIDDTMLQVAASICDENVALSGGGTEKRYECHGVLSAQNTPANNLSEMITSCAGTIFWGSGKWKIKVGAYSSPVKDFTLDDLRSEISVKTRTSARDNFNSVQGTFIDAAQDWVSADYPQIKSTGTFLFEDGGVENTLDLNLSFTSSSSMAQRLAKQTLFRNREQITVGAEFGMAAFEVEIGDLIRLTVDRYGWSSKEFEVLSWSLNPSTDAGDMRIAMTLQETSQAAFSWDAEERQIVANNTTLPTFYDSVGFGFTPKLENSSSNENLQRDLMLYVSSTNLQRIERLEVELQRSTDNTGALSPTGLINRELVLEGMSAGDDLFTTQTIGSRKIGDINNDGSVDQSDVDDYAEYYYGNLTDSAKLTRIGELHTYMLERPQMFARYVYSDLAVNTDYENVFTGPPPKLRVQNIGNGFYNIKVTPITKLGLRGSPVVHPNFEVPFSDGTIAAPTEGFVSVNDVSSTQLYWDASGSQTLSHYEVRHSQLVHGATVASGSFVAGLHYIIKTVGTTDFTVIGAASNTVGLEFWCLTDIDDDTAYNQIGQGTGTATNVVYIDKTVPWADKVARPANNAVVGTKEGTYVVRAISKSGTPSLDYLRLPLTGSEISNPYSNTTTMTLWASNSVPFENIWIDVFSPGPFPSGTYVYPSEYKGKIIIWGYASHPDLAGGNDLDLGSVKDTRVTFDYDFARLNLDNNKTFTIDNVFGIWDNLGSLVDDINDEIQADFKIIPYADVGNGFQRVTSNVIKGRYFKFKVEVLSMAYNAGPVFRGASSFSEPSTGLFEWTGGITARVEY